MSSLKLKIGDWLFSARRKLVDDNLTVGGHIKKQDMNTIGIRIQRLDLCYRGNKYTFFVFPYDNNTKIWDLCVSIAKHCGDDRPHAEVFIDYKGKQRRLVKDVEVYKLVGLLNRDTINVSYPCGIGAEYDRVNGVIYSFHSNESAHTPHVHVRISGNEASVDLLSFKIKGKIEISKKNEVLKYIRDNQKELIEFYREHTNGVFVDPIII